LWANRVDMDDVIRVIDEALEKAGLTDAAASKLAGDNPSVIKNLRMQRGVEKRYNYLTLQRIADVLNLELYFGPPRDNAPIQQTTVDGADYAAIPKRNVTASAGAGTENSAEEVVGTFAFRRDWLAARGIAASNAVLIDVRGDSMLPIISDGDSVMVDTARNSPTVRPRDTQGNRRSDIYALVQNGEARIKWVERPDTETLILYSENLHNYPPEILAGTDAAAVQIVGKVVWWGHPVG